MKYYTFEHTKCDYCGKECDEYSEIRLDYSSKEICFSCRSKLDIFLDTLKNENNQPPNKINLCRRIYNWACLHL